VIDPTDLIGPLEEGNPSGPNLEYDPAFQELERAQQGKPEQVMGGSVKAAEEPDWREVGERAEALLRRTRDLRVAVTLAQAQLKIDGLPGFLGGLKVIKGLLETQWETVHPQLDADDDNDPTLRINTIQTLASLDAVRKSLREAPLVYSPTLGRFNFRDILIASGKEPKPANMTDPPNQTRIDAAFLDAKLEPLQATFSQVQEIAGIVADIDRLLVDRLAGRAPDLDPLIRDDGEDKDKGDLIRIEEIMAPKLAARGVDVAVEGDRASGPGGAEAGEAPRIATAGEISSRDDVVRQLDRLCDYYARYEPSSPIPILLRRAKRLVKKDFMEIVRDLTPGGLAELEALAGVEKSDG
jgi:type VI secretion system protein ImpA